MTKEASEQLIHKWFWTFAEKLTREYPEYTSTFEYIISNSFDNRLLWEVLEFANGHLEVDSHLKGGVDNLIVTDYLTALEYGYDEWIK